MKTFVRPLLIAFIIINAISIKAQFNYLEALQKYWNYRYHLIGDVMNGNQVMTWHNDYRYALGEPGMIVIGTAPGNSIPATNIQLYGIENRNPHATVVELGTEWTLIDLQPPFLPNGTPPYNVFQPLTPGSSADKSCFNQILAHGSILEDRAGVVGFDDQTPNRLAQYIIVLATEWKLLHQNNQVLAAMNTEQELYYALNALSRMDRFTESKFPNEAPGENGFFIEMMFLGIWH